METVCGLCFILLHGHNNQILFVYVVYNKVIKFVGLAIFYIHNMKLRTLPRLRLRQPIKSLKMFPTFAQISLDVQLFGSSETDTHASVNLSSSSSDQFCILGEIWFLKDQTTQICKNESFKQHKCVSE